MIPPNDEPTRTIYDYLNYKKQGNIVITNKPMRVEICDRLEISEMTFYRSLTRLQYLNIIRKLKRQTYLIK